MKKNNWKSFNIDMPKELIPIYDFLQLELNYILTNYKSELNKVNLNQHKGNVAVSYTHLTLLTN